MHDLEVGIVQQCLEVSTREPLRGVCEIVKVNTGRYGDFSRVRL
jgi:hypothetical protein